jgi:hypothetical protein
VATSRHRRDEFNLRAFENPVNLSSLVVDDYCEFNQYDSARSSSSRKIQVCCHMVVWNMILRF